MGGGTALKLCASQSLKLAVSQKEESWAAAICTTDGQRFARNNNYLKKVKLKLRFSMGDADVPFVVDSTSKPFTYALCLDQLGAEVTISYVLQI